MIRIIVCIDCIIVSCLNLGYFFLFNAAYSSLKINQQASEGVIASSAILSISESFKGKVGLLQFYYKKFRYQYFLLNHRGTFPKV